MSKERSESQAVDAFSAPKDLLRAAQVSAKKRRMTKSGFYRYCLAKEVGFSEQQALRMAENPSIGEFQAIGTLRRKVNYRKKKEKKS